MAAVEESGRHVGWRSGVWWVGSIEGQVEIHGHTFNSSTS